MTNYLSHRYTPYVEKLNDWDQSNAAASEILIDDFDKLDGSFGCQGNHINSDGSAYFRKP